MLGVSKMIKRLAVVAFSASLLTACNAPEEETTDVPTDAVDSLVTAAPAEETPAVAGMATTELIDTAFNKTGLVRGVNLGDALSTVRQNETLELFEDEGSQLGYTFEAHTMQSVDVAYVGNEQGKVRAIQVDFFVNSAAEMADLKNAVEQHLTNRFGVSEKGTWKLPSGGSATIETINKSPDFGLKIRFQ